MKAPTPEYVRLAEIMDSAPMPRGLAIEIANWVEECRRKLPSPLGWQENAQLRKRVAELENTNAALREKESITWKKYADSETTIEVLRQEKQDAGMPKLIFVLSDKDGKFTEHQVREMARQVYEATKESK